MNRCLILKFLLFFFCLSVYVADLSIFEGYDIYPVFDRANCAFPFNYSDKTYYDCTNDGDNGALPWCSMTPAYQGLIKYCYDFRYTTLECLPSFQMPNGKVYTGCDYLSPAATYKQCKTSHPTIKYRYCTDALASPYKKSAGRLSNCDPNYAKLAQDHTMCFAPSPYGFVVPLNSTEKQDILDVHNSYRAAVPSRYMFKLYWDDELAKLAQAHSNLCVFEHDLAINRLSPLYNWKNGQNIVMSSEIRSSPAELIDMMLDAEKVYFRYGDTCDDGGNTCLHYTQAMLSNLTRVGCGQTHCVYPDRIERHLSCNYIQSQYEDNYQTPYIPHDIPAVDCPHKASDGLCDCQNKICRYHEDEYLHPDTCHCRKTKSKRSVREIDPNGAELEKGRDHFVGMKSGKISTKGKLQLGIQKIGVQKRATNVADPNEDELQKSEGNFVGIKNGQTGDKGKRHFTKIKKVGVQKRSPSKKIPIKYQN